MQHHQLDIVSSSIDSGPFSHHRWCAPCKRKKPSPMIDSFIWVWVGYSLSQNSCSSSGPIAPKSLSMNYFQVNPVPHWALEIVITQNGNMHWSCAAEPNDDLQSTDAQTHKSTQSQGNNHKHEDTIDGFTFLSYGLYGPNSSYNDRPISRIWAVRV